ncbi:MAG: FtsW/RodA/SpoVE family cell cycle protein, partial [Verrucomicrobiota bacterium]
MFEEALNEHQPRVDRLQLVAVAGLMFIGAAFVYSATMVSEAAQQQAVYNQLWFRQLIWYALGLGAAVGVCIVDYRTLARWSGVVYAVNILFLVAVLIPGIGTTHGWGARRWIDFGPFQMQPSEFAKLAFILAMANFLSRPAEELRQPRTFWKALGLILLPFLLILKEPDLGSALVLLPTGLVMLYAAGTPGRFLTRLFAGVGILAAFFLVDILFAPPNWQIKLEDYQRRRLLVYFGKDYAPAQATRAELARLRKQQFDDSHNVRQALISVGSGGLLGKGWRQGTQNALGYLPRAVAHNDFIFSVIAEEEGF